MFDIEVAVPGQATASVAGTDIMTGHPDNSGSPDGTAGSSWANTDPSGWLALEMDVDTDDLDVLSDKTMVLVVKACAMSAFAPDEVGLADAADAPPRRTGERAPHPTTNPIRHPSDQPPPGP